MLLNNKIVRWIELVIVYICIPLAYYFLIKNNNLPVHKALPLVTIFFIYLFILIRDNNFSNKKLVWIRFGQWKKRMRIFLTFLVLSLMYVYFFEQEKMFQMVKETPVKWMVIILTYPIWSVIPQELIYRSYFFYRFRLLIKNYFLFLLINAALFSLPHIIFENWFAIVFTFAGSLIFASTYNKNGSLLVVSLEHGLYGAWIFTVGLGEYFYLPLATNVLNV